LDCEECQKIANFAGNHLLPKESPFGLYHDHRAFIPFRRVSGSSSL
jgi:hypothetical protein